jgi:adenosine deaminase
MDTAIKNDLLLEIMRKKNIPIELSPLSNQDLFYYKVEENPISKLIKKGYPININSNDPGMFGYEGHKGLVLYDNEYRYATKRFIFISEKFFDLFGN